MSEHSCASSCGCSGAKASTATSTASAPAAAATTSAPATSSGPKTAQNGKGSGPRNISKRFLNNYDSIRWEEKGKKLKPGKKFVKVYA